MSKFFGPSGLVKMREQAATRYRMPGSRILCFKKPQCMGWVSIALRKTQKKTGATSALQFPPAKPPAARAPQHARVLFSEDASQARVIGVSRQLMPALKALHW